MAIVFAYKDQYIPTGRSKTLLGQIASLDLVATILLAGTVSCLVLPLQWGGSTYKWSDARIVTLLVLFGVLLITLVVHQVWRGEAAMIPRRVSGKREMVGAPLYAFFIGGTANVLEYYVSKRTPMMILLPTNQLQLPIWFQEVWLVTALKSGIYTIPMVAGFVVFSIVAGFGVSYSGYYLPFMYLGGCALIVGSALLTIIRPTSPLAALVGFEILIGVGGGSGIQQAYLVAQTVLDTKDVAIGLAVIVMAQTLGGTVLLSVATSVVQGRLATATHDGDVAAASKAIVSAYYLSIAAGVGSLVSLLLLRMRSIKASAGDRK